tara:strand:+ start:5371 stop:6957 length:1587 start_codon:yes stop_codon:yes gene_type:complete
MYNKKKVNMFKKYFFNKENSNYLYLFIFYSIAHIWIFFLSNSLFWDDWSIYGSSQEINNLRFLMSGNPFFGSIHELLLKVGLPIYRYTTYIIIFITSIFIDKILIRTNLISNDMRFGLCLLYLTTPFYIARVTIICFPYTFCLFLFFAAWFFFNKYRFLSIILFLISFTTNSLLVFYCLPVFEDFFIKFKSFSLKKYIERNIFILLLPFAFYISKIFIFKPFGIYKGYLSNFDIKNIFTASFFQLIDAIKLKSNFIILIPILVLFISYIFYKFIFSNTDCSDRKNARIFFIFGIISFISGVFPYWILNYTPAFNGWLSRHQLLMPLGIAIIISSMLLNFNFEGRRILLSMFVSIFLIINISNYFSLISDNIKQNQIVEILSNKINVKNSNLIVFEDNTNNALDRKYRFYEWNGLINKAYPAKNIIGINSFESIDQLNFISKIYQSKCQNFYGIKNNSLPDEIEISKLKIIYSSVTGPNSFITNIFYRLKNFNTKPIEIEIVDKYKIDKNLLIPKRGINLINCKALENK